MRAGLLSVGLLAVLALPGPALAAYDQWLAGGSGTADGGAYDCAAAYQVSMDRTGPNAWYTNVEIYAYPNRNEIFGCLPRGYVFPQVNGSPQSGWITQGVFPCAHYYLRIDPFGSLPGGLTRLEFFYADLCNGRYDNGEASLVFVTPDV